jgi:hypothetical protein
MQAQLAKDVNSTTTGREVPLYEFISKLVFQASVASLFSPEAAEDPDLFEAFRAFDQHMPLAAGGYKVRGSDSSYDIVSCLFAPANRHLSVARWTTRPDQRLHGRYY